MINKQAISILKINSGKVELRKVNGAFIRTIGNDDATNTRFSRSDIVVLINKGKTELRNEGGSLIRVI